jgi:hypothetical protein
MKKYSRVISAVVLMAMTTVSCAQISDKKEATAAVGPELRWKYETDG